MRINVYSQELTKEVHLVSKFVEDTGIRYWGVRVYLASPSCLHHTEQDDDRSAITFWVPHANSFTPEDLASVFHEMGSLANQVVVSNYGTTKYAPQYQPKSDSFGHIPDTEHGG